MTEHDKYCLYYGTQLNSENCVDCKRISQVRDDAVGGIADTLALSFRIENSVRNQIFTDVDNYYEYWADEMSSDAVEWVTDILNIIRGVPYNYPMGEY